MKPSWGSRYLQKAAMALKRQWKCGFTCSPESPGFCLVFSSCDDVCVLVCRLIYNRTTHTSSSPPGVDIRVPGFGQTFSLEYVDPSERGVGELIISNKTITRMMWEQSSVPPHTHNLRYTRHSVFGQHQHWICFLYSLVCCFCVSGMYFFTIVQTLVDSGYTRGDDVRGAPYDWRRAPSKQSRRQKSKLLFSCSSFTVTSDESAWVNV